MTDYYRKVPTEMRETFFRFRREHPLKTANLENISWEYILAGEPAGQPLVLLPGGLSTAESAWRMLTHLDHHRYRLLCPSYPREISTMTSLADGIARIMELEGFFQSFLVGGAYGAMLAQVYAHRHSAQVSRLVLTHAYPPVASRAVRVEPTLRILRYAPMFMVRNILRAQMTGKLAPNAPAELQLIAAQVRETVEKQITRQAAMNIYLRMANFDQQNFTYTDFEGWTGKTLIILAEDDPTSTEELRNTMLSLYPGAVLHLLQGSIQSSSLLDPAEYVTIMEDFFAGKPDGDFQPPGIDQ